MLLTIAAFLFVLGVLIFVHELGHFLAAKAVGIGAPRFSIGFGPPTPINFRWGETQYVVSWIPFGGYVKMASREEQEAMASLEGGELEQEYPPEKLFENKPLWARILVISAGVTMNALFAWGAYTGLLAINGRTELLITQLDRVETETLPPQAAALSELPFGARITAINGEAIESWNQIEAAVTDLRTERLRFEFADGLAPITVEIPGTVAEARYELATSLYPLRPARVGTLVADGPAATAGIESGDTVTAIDGRPVRSWGEMVEEVESGAGRELALTVDRDGETLTVPVVPEAQEVADPVTGEKRTVGRIGIGNYLETRQVRYGLAEAVVEGGRETWRKAGEVLVTLKGMIIGDVSVRQMGGPILIGQASGQFARAGLASLLAFMGFLSINLAILNLLPIPVLDGGHLIFLLLEGVRGKPLPQALRYRLTQVGLFLLLGIMAFALVNDTLRVLG